MNEELVTLQLQELARQLRSRGYSQEHLLQLISGDESIPATVFATDISPLQALVIYLKDSQGITLSNIATKIKRSYRAIWGSYAPRELNITPTPYYLPISIFNDKLSILEAAVSYLKDHYHLKFSQIAKIVNKDDRTIWTTYKRAVNKRA